MAIGVFTAQRNIFMTVDEIINHKDFPILVRFALNKFRGNSSVSFRELLQLTRIRIFRFYKEERHANLKLSTIVVLNVKWSINEYNRVHNGRHAKFNNSMQKFSVLHQNLDRKDIWANTNTNNDAAKELLEEILVGQPSRTKKMIVMRTEGYTLREIGRHFGISCERVRQIIEDVHSDFKERMVEC